jgi:hypothetical protein
MKPEEINVAEPDGLIVVGAGVMSDIATLKAERDKFKEDYEVSFAEWQTAVKTIEDLTARAEKAEGEVAERRDDIKIIAGLNGVVDRLTAERDILKEKLSAILCRIHRDGGHYIQNYGEQKAFEDADTKVADTYAELDSLKSLCEKMTGVNTVLRAALKMYAGNRSPEWRLIDSGELAEQTLRGLTELQKQVKDL